MSLESFFGLEDGESQGSAEAAEKFREQMAKNAKAIKNMSAHQQQQKKKEDKLAALLAKFLKDQSKSDTVFLIVRLLQENVPGAFILAILSVSNHELESELRKEFESAEAEAPLFENSLPETLSMPPQIRADLDAWGEAILRAGLMMPGRTLQSVLTPDNKLKSLILDLLDFSLEEYFENHGFELSESNIRQFALISIQSVLLKLRAKNQEISDGEIVELPLEVEEPVL